MIFDLLDETSIYLAGGDPVNGMLLTSKVEDAAKSCLDRLYPQFHLADSPEWHKVIERAKKGDGDALAAVGHKGDPEAHAVCKAILDFVGSREERDGHPQELRQSALWLAPRRHRRRADRCSTPAARCRPAAAAR